MSHVPNSPEELLALQKPRDCDCPVCTACKTISDMGLKFNELSALSVRITESLLSHTQDQLGTSEERQSVVVWSALMGKFSTLQVTACDALEMIEAFSEDDDEIECQGT